jgi:polar amino acid transport system substrate-binding protein
MVIGFLILVLLSAVQAQEFGGRGLRDAKTTASPAWRVGLKEAPPFSFKNSAGEWEGISVSLWQAIADDVGLTYAWEERDLPGLLEGVSDGSLDAAIGALTITVARETRFDFSHAFFHTGLGVAVRKRTGLGFMRTLLSLVKGGLLRTLGVVVLCLLIFTWLIAFFERRLLRRRPDQIGKARAGVESSLWWLLVILMGKNESHPVSFGGRVLALAWMVMALVFVSSVTALITSALTVNELQSSITDPNDLAKVRLVSVSDSSSAEFLSHKRLGFRAVRDLESGLKLVADRHADAIVYDKPLLHYVVNRNFQDQLEVVAFTLAPQNYAFALQNDSPWLEDINRSLLVHTHEPAWDALLFRYLGQ